MSAEQSAPPQEARVQPTEPKPRVWVGSWSDYNAGYLHGRWIAAHQPAEAIWAEINDMLAQSQVPGAEEHGIFDYDGFGPLQLDEQTAIEEVARLGQGIDLHGDAYAHLASVLGTSALEVLDRFHELFLGEWGSLSEYCDELVADLGVEDLLDEALPQWLRSLVKVDQVALTAMVSSELHVSDSPTGVYLFHAP